MTSSSRPLDSLLRDAAAARQRKDGPSEQRILEAALTAYPDDPRAQNAMGMRALTDGDPDRAATHFARAAAADPNEPALHLNLATAHRARGDAVREQAALQAALDIDQLSFAGQLRMAELLQRIGEVSRAARHWAAVVQLAAGMTNPAPAIVAAAGEAQTHLTEHNTAYERALTADLGALPEGEPTRRFRACVDHMLGRRRVYRNECAGVYYPFLPADEFFDRSLFRWFAAIEARVPAIRGEALALLEAGGHAIRPYVRLDPGTPENKWSALDQSLAWSACFLWEYGEKNDAVCARCPETTAALAAIPQSHIPGKAPSAFFSILRPRAHIPAHTGVTNTRAIVHLPLVVPDQCRFRVGGETRVWREGEAFAFDDTIEHEAWNDSDDVRIVLIFDVWNPHLSEAEQVYLTKLFAVADRGLVSPKA